MVLDFEMNNYQWLNQLIEYVYWILCFNIPNASDYHCIQKYCISDDISYYIRHKAYHQKGRNQCIPMICLDLTEHNYI